MTSVFRSICRVSRARLWISAMSCRTSSAVAPPSLTMKFPCTSETRAGADRKIFQAQFIDQFTPRGSAPGLEDAAGARRGGLRRPALVRVGLQLFVDLIPGTRRTLQPRGDGNVGLEMGDAAVMNFHVGLLHLVDMAEEIDAADAFDHLHRPALHRAGIHAQCAAHIAGNAFHELESAEVVLARIGDDLLEPRTRADGDVLALDFDAAEIGPAEMDAKAENSAVADEQVAAAADERDRDAAIVREAKGRE